MNGGEPRIAIWMGAAMSPQELSLPCPCFLVVDFPAVEGSGILRFGSGHADAEGVELLFVADDDPVTCPGVQVGMPGSHRYEVGGGEFAWGEVARHDHAG